MEPETTARALARIGSLARSARRRGDEAELAAAAELREIVGAMQLEISALQARLECAENEIAMLKVIAQ